MKLNIKTYCLLLIDFLIFFLVLATSNFILELQIKNLIIYCGSGLFSLIILYVFGVYSSVQSELNLSKDYWKFLFGSLINSIIVYVFCKNIVLSSLSFIFTFLLFLLSRNLWKLYNQIKFSKKNPENVAIFGAGNAGAKLAKVLQVIKEKRIIFFIDDNENLHGRRTNGIPIISRKEIKSMIKENHINEIVIAIPSLENIQKEEIIKFLSSFPVALRSAPNLKEISSGKSIDNLENITLEEALGRNPVEPNHNLIKECISMKTVLVTGGGGSIGSELCRQILKAKPENLLILDSSEFSLYKIDKELKEEFSKIKIRSYLGSVTDDKFIKNVFNANKIDVIFHAAAYKHVPLVEENIIEATKNNINGMLVISKNAEEYGVKNFVLVSSDKAVRTTNVMGATKRICELILQAKSDLSDDIKFSMVRFGNVLNSSGSVVPLFKKQIIEGGPLTLTHKDITRYFMTIEEAAQLVIQSASLSEGGDVFVLDMGDPIRIYDLAKFLIYSSGFQINGETKNNNRKTIEIKEIGLRPGEKLFEELIIDENALSTAHPKIMKAREGYISWDLLKEKLQRINKIIENNNDVLLKEFLLELAHHD